MRIYTFACVSSHSQVDVGVCFLKSSVQFFHTTKSNAIVSPVSEWAASERTPVFSRQINCFLIFYIKKANDAYKFRDNALLLHTLK